jgi:cytochrome c oxidase subunit 2
MIGSEVAKSWNHLYIFLIVASVIFFVLVIGLMVLFSVKYSRKSGAVPEPIEGNVPLEIFWTAIPTILLLFIFAWGYSLYKEMVTVPYDAMEIHVIGKQWLWQFQYEDGRTTIGDLYVPMNKPIKLVMTSEDVLHGFFIPDFRIKKDVVPGTYTNIWFEATVAGEHQAYCTEYCGTAHSGMLAKIHALPPDQWDAWKNGRKTVFANLEASTATLGAPVKPELKSLSLADQGKILSQTKGCVACHSDDGTKRIGPSYKNLFGKDEELADGSKVKVDDNYIRESIENPTAKIVKGYNPVMPMFRGLLKEEELNALIAYIKSLK